MDSVALLRERRYQIQARIEYVLRIDQRVVAAWYTGSVGREKDDAWSDIDLALAIRDDKFSDFWQDRVALYQQIDTPILIQREIPQNSSLSGGSFQLVIYPGPIEVDWTAGPASLATRPVASRLLFDRASIPQAQGAQLSTDAAAFQAASSVEFFWAMALVAVKYAARRHTAAAIRQTALLEQSVQQLGEALLVLTPDLTALAFDDMPESINPLDALDHIATLCSIVDETLPFLAKEHRTAHHGISIETHRLIALARNLLREGQLRSSAD